MNVDHFKRHAVGYATIIGSMLAVVIGKLQSQWPANARDWTLLVLTAVAAGCTTITAYRSFPGGAPVPPSTTTTNSN